MYNTTCMTHNRLSNFYSVYTIVQVVHTKSIKVVLADYSAFRSSSKMIEERAAAAVKEKEKKRKVYGEPLLKKKKKRRILWNSACRTVVRRRT